MSKTIYCPECKRKVGTYDGRSTFIITYNCQKCRKRVVYNPSEDKAIVKKIMRRQVSSGITLS